jgi:hypothetical protein
MTDEQQEIDDYITRIIEKWEGLELDRSMDDETKKAKVKEPILDLASLLQSKGHRPDGICDEMFHLLKGVVDEVLIRIILRDTRFQASVNLKVYDSHRDQDAISF